MRVKVNLNQLEQMLEETNIHKFWEQVKKFAVDTILDQAKDLINVPTISRSAARAIWNSPSSFEEYVKGKELNPQTLVKGGQIFYRGDEERRKTLYDSTYKTDNEIKIPEGNIIVNRKKEFQGDEDNGYRLVASNHDVDFTKAWMGGFRVYVPEAGVNPQKPKNSDEYRLMCTVEGSDILITATLTSMKKIVEYALGLFKSWIEKL